MIIMTTDYTKMLMVGNTFTFCLILISNNIRYNLRTYYPFLIYA